MREDILLYIETNRINIFLRKKNKEFNVEVDTSLFFRYGEIYDVEKCEEVLVTLLPNTNIKSNFIILYNDVTNSDLKCLYRCTLNNIEYNDIIFVPLSLIVSKIDGSKNVVVWDGECYTIVDKGVKCNEIKNVDFTPIIIGKKTSKYKHYADLNIIWNTFKICCKNKKSLII